MKNYSLEWKKYVNFKEISYNDFLVKFHEIKDAYYLEKIDGMLGALIYIKDKDIFFQTWQMWNQKNR